MTASFDGHVDVVRVLIEAHADVHSQDKVWYTGQPAYRLHVCADRVLLWFVIYRTATRHFTRHHKKVMLMWFVY